LYFQFVLYNSVHFYTFEIRGKDKKIHIYDETGTRIVDAEFTDSSWNEMMYLSTTGTDILDQTNYEPGGTLSGLNTVKNFIENASPSDPVNLAIQFFGTKRDAGGGEHDGGVTYRNGDWIIEIQII